MTFIAAAQGAVMAETDKRGTESPYGVLEFLPWDHDWNGHHYTYDKVKKAVLLMKEAGVGIVRMDFLWNDVQPSKSGWDFEKYDDLTSLLQRNNIKILGMLNYTADWAGSSWNSAPNKDLFLIYVREVVSRYKGKVKYWEFWNEPNQSIYWVPQDGMKAYTALLKDVYRTVKEADPTAQVLLGGLSGDTAGSLWQVYKNGGKNYFDIVNIHPFQDPLSPKAMIQMKAEHQAVYKAMVKNGDGSKPIWFTELGCPGVPKDKGTADWWKGKNPSEEQQAAWVRKVYAEPLRWNNVDKIFWAFFRDTPNHFQTGTDYFGLVREDFTVKPAYEAYKEKAAR